MIRRDLGDSERFDVPPAAVHLPNSTDPFSQARYYLSATTVGNKPIFAAGRYENGGVHFSDVADIHSPAPTPIPGDTDRDGDGDFTGHITVKGSFGFAVAGPGCMPTIPRPATLALLALGGVVRLRRRRR